MFGKLRLPSREIPTVLKEHHSSPRVLNYAFLFWGGDASPRADVPSLTSQNAVDRSQVSIAWRPSSNSFLITCFWILPEPVRGNLSITTKYFGTLYPAIRAAQCARKSAWLIEAPG